MFVRPIINTLQKLILLTVLSIACFGPARAHEVRPAIADIQVEADRVLISIRLTLEPMLAGMDVAGLENTNDSPLSGLYDQLRALPPDTLEKGFMDTWPTISGQITLRAGTTKLTPSITGLSIPEVGDIDLPRDSTLILHADLPDDGSPVEFGWASAYGPLVIRQVGGGEDAYTAILNNGEISAPLPRETIATEGILTAFARYVLSGFEHIVPKGLDHILFVLGLFFFSLKARPLLAQVTAFTLAHTVTLALGSLGIITLPASIVEPLIAASIVYVAVENIFGGKIGLTRIAVVFCFGLLHGLGFASVLGDVGLQSGRFVVGLIGFNIGVELGQLAVVLVAFVLLGWPFGGKPWYRQRVVIPASAAIAAIGAYWTIERVFF